MSTRIALVLGIIVGALINHFIIKPIEQKYYRKKCIEEGLAKEGGKDED